MRQFITAFEEGINETFDAGYYYVEEATSNNLKIFDTDLTYYEIKYNGSNKYGSRMNIVPNNEDDTKPWFSIGEYIEEDYTMQRIASFISKNRDLYQSTLILLK